MSTPGYAELHCLSNFSFQRGASSAEELFRRAREQGYQALAITDECTLAGIVRAWQAAKEQQLRLIVGSEVRLQDGPKLVLLVQNLTGYQNLCALITRARRRAEKGDYQLFADDLELHHEGLLALWIADDADDQATGRWLCEMFAERLWLGVHLHRGSDDARRLARLRELAAQLGVRAVACGDVHMHVRGRRALQDCMTAIRHHCNVAQAGRHLFANGERHLRSLEQLGELYPKDLLAESLVIAERCQFDLAELSYQYPRELVPEGQTPASWLRALCERGLPQRWPSGPSSKVRAVLDKELTLIEELGYESYFLTVHDIVAFARSQHILCQGRGSAANSVVCFVLGITELDPMEHRLLFERFLSRERNEPPDIDVDFEHDRREEVIQYVFRRYGRHRAALTAVVNTYHAAGAVRDVARVLGLPADQVDALAKCCGRWSDRIPDAQRLAEAGFEPGSPSLRRILVLAGELIGFPRHLSQHPGGFVISEQPLAHLVPVENAAMAERTVIQWDKDDLDMVGLLKVDVLALGMLSALRRCFDLLQRHRGRQLTLATIPGEDPATYAMISRAETMGVFQIESRAQMAMLPRLKPETFYDLVIEVAIVRPGQSRVTWFTLPASAPQAGAGDLPSAKLKEVFERTLGVPLFQEQVMELAMVAADYSPGEADQLRRSMAAWKRHGGLEPHRQRLVEGMLRNGYDLAFAERIFEQIKGFGSYGFLNRTRPASPCCAMPAAGSSAMNRPSSPVPWSTVGRWGSTARINCCRRRGDKASKYVRWMCSIANGTARWSPISTGSWPSASGCDRSVVSARRMPAGWSRRGRSAPGGMSRMCACALDSTAVPAPDWPMRGTASPGPRPPPGALAGGGGTGAVAAVCRSAGSTGSTGGLARTHGRRRPGCRLRHAGNDPGPHPLRLLRSRLRALGCRSSAELAGLEHGDAIAVAGLVVGRQRPQTASGVTFVTLEDEHGMVNVVVWRDLAERQRRALVGSQLLKVSGRLEQDNGVRHLIARRLEDISPLLQGLDVKSRDFH